MSNSFDRPARDPGAPPVPHQPVPSSEPSAQEEASGEEAVVHPWDIDPPEDPDAPRRRHDAFTEARKCEFLRALVKTGCILDACRLTGISSRTVYRHQQDSPSFFDNCCVALRMSGTPIELTAWQRGVEGVEEEFVVGGEVRVRRRYDGSLLRLLLQGSNPKKYGPRPGFKRKRLLKHERKQMAREIRAEIEAEQKPWTFDEAIAALETKLKPFGARQDQERLEAGWTKTPDGHWVPPGYGPIAGWSPPASDSDGRGGIGGEEPPLDSM